MFSKYRGEWLLVLTTISAALGWIFSKNAVAELPPLAFNSMRFFFSGLIFLPFAIRQLKALTLQQWLYSIYVGWSLVFYLTFYILGVKVSSELGKGAFLLSLSMLAAPLLAWLIFKDQPKAIFFIALIPAVMGMYLLSANGSMSLDLDVILFLLTALCAAVQYVLNNKYARAVPPLSLTIISLFMVGICHAIGSLIFEQIPQNVSNYSWLWLGLSVLIGTSARFLLQTIGQKLSDVSSGAVIMILEPVWTMILSIIFLAEQISSSKLIGSALILLALFVYRSSSLLKKFKFNASTC